VAQTFNVKVVRVCAQFDQADELAYGCTVTSAAEWASLPSVGGRLPGNIPPVVKLGQTSMHGTVALRCATRATRVDRSPQITYEAPAVIKHDPDG
jgi:hypothetical protein